MLGVSYIDPFLVNEVLAKARPPFELLIHRLLNGKDTKRIWLVDMVITQPTVGLVRLLAFA